MAAIWKSRVITWNNVKFVAEELFFYSVMSGCGAWFGGVNTTRTEIEAVNGR